MMENLVEEVMRYFWAERSRLKRELTKKEEEHKKAIESLARLPLVSFLKQPLRPLLKWLLPPRVKKLKREIEGLKPKIDQYLRAETDLKKGEYATAIPLLDELADRFFPAAPLILGSEGMSAISMPNPEFYRILELQKELTSRQEGEKAT